MPPKDTLRTLKDFERSVGVDFAGEVINTLLKELRVEAAKCLRSERIKHMSATDFILWWCNLTEADIELNEAEEECGERRM